jgi:hypothetical protein
MYRLIKLTYMAERGYVVSVRYCVSCDLNMTPYKGLLKMHLLIKKFPFLLVGQGKSLGVKIPKRENNFFHFFPFYAFSNANIFSNKLFNSKRSILSEPVV